MTSKSHAVAAACAAIAVLAAPASALAIDYPAPQKPKGSTAKPKGPFHTLKVSKSKSAKYHTIQAAVNAAKPGDTVKVADGTYREGVTLTGTSKRYIKLVGNVKDPQNVVIDAKGLKGPAAQNGVLIDNNANEVTVKGFKAMNQKSNGFFVRNVDGYTFTRLIAAKTGVYGIYAFNAVGGKMTDSLSYYQSDGSYYVGQTKPQTKPKRTLLSGLVGWGSVLGYSGSNSRYVTITKSKFFNNGSGIVPNAINSEKYAPAESNVIRDNDVFWNNFNFRAGAPFSTNNTSNETIQYPAGLGILLFGGRDTLVENNRIYGNFLAGWGGLQSIILENKADSTLERNTVRNNQFGLNGTDKNGRDLSYDGDGSGNCFSGNTGVEVTSPAKPEVFPACPFTGPNTFDKETQDTSVSWAGSASFEQNWLRHDHAARTDGITPLEHFEAGKVYGPTTL